MSSSALVKMSAKLQGRGSHMRAFVEAIGYIPSMESNVHPEYAYTIHIRMLMPTLHLGRVSHGVCADPST